MSWKKTAKKDLSLEDKFELEKRHLERWKFIKDGKVLVDLLYITTDEPKSFVISLKEYTDDEVPKLWRLDSFDTKNKAVKFLREYKKNFKKEKS
jgi:hypothetical protein